MAANDQQASPPGIGIVVIGRNEGERLRACLRSLASAAAGCPVVYVDSGSSDRSVTLAREVGAAVVELDPAGGFTAARGRNAGLRHLAEHRPDCLMVQFIDGDCELMEGWLCRGSAALERDPGVVCVFGRLRETASEPKVFRRLLDLEWRKAAVGQACSFGGNALARVDALLEVNGFDPTLIAGEEPELCLRLRRRGWRILGLEAEMARHDGGMRNVGQLWRRALRHGWAVAAMLERHGAAGDRRAWLSGWVWGALLPLGAVAAVVLAPVWTLAIALAYLMLGMGIARRERTRGMSAPDARLYALYCVLSKLPQAIGQLRHLVEKLSGRGARLIEYKTAPAGGPPRRGRS